MARRGLSGSEVLAVLAQVEESVAKLAVERDLIAADKFDAADVVADLWDGGVARFVVGLGTLRFTGEGLPGFDQVEVFVFG